MVVTNSEKTDLVNSRCRYSVGSARSGGWLRTWFNSSLVWIPMILSWEWAFLHNWEILPVKYTQRVIHDPSMG